MKTCESRDSSVGIATGYELDGWGSIPSRVKIYPFSTASRTYLEWVLGTLSPRVKGLGHEADHSPPSSAKVNNDGTVHPLPHMSVKLT
jgi:hypothetical protein